MENQNKNVYTFNIHEAMLSHYMSILQIRADSREQAVEILRNSITPGWKYGDISIHNEHVAAWTEAELVSSDALYPGELPQSTLVIDYADRKGEPVRVWENNEDEL